MYNTDWKCALNNGGRVAEQNELGGIAYRKDFLFSFFENQKIGKYSRKFRNLLDSLKERHFVSNLVHYTRQFT